MSFQVNGTTVLDMNRAFASSAFGQTVNGQNISGTGELQFQRAGVASDHVVGDYLLCGHSSMSYNGYTYGTFAAGTTHAGSGMVYRNQNPVVGWSRGSGWASSTNAYDTNVNVGGTWRVCVQGAHANAQAAAKQAIFFARIS